MTASIVTYHTAFDELRRCLDCLLASDEVQWVMVVDNGQEERIRAFLDANYPTAASAQRPRVVYLPHPNRGYGAGHNIALRRALREGHDYHLVINSDVYFAPATLEALVAYMKAHPDVGQAIPNVHYPDGRQQYVCRLLPTPADVFGRRFLPRRWMTRRDRRYTLAFTGYTLPMNAPYHTGCFMLLRVAALPEVAIGHTTADANQYFDERFFMYPEDIDLTRRIHRKWLTMYVPDVCITHDHRAASYHNLKMLWIHAVNMCRYFNKWGWWHDAERSAFNQRLLNELAKAGSTPS